MVFKFFSLSEILFFYILEWEFFQIEKVTKAYRVYRSEGPKTHEDDYIVDHTVIMYLVDPEGNFHDYYGQNRRTSEIVNIIRTKQLKYGFKKKSAGSWFNFNTGGSAS